MTLTQKALARRKRTEMAVYLARDLEEQRVLRGLNKTEFAKLIGCGTAFYHATLARTGNPTIHTVAQWAEALGLECRVVFSKREE